MRKLSCPEPWDSSTFSSALEWKGLLQFAVGYGSFLFCITFSCFMPGWWAKIYMYEKDTSYKHNSQWCLKSILCVTAVACKTRTTPRDVKLVNKSVDGSDPSSWIRYVMCYEFTHRFLHVYIYIYIYNIYNHTYTYTHTYTHTYIICFLMIPVVSGFDLDRVRKKNLTHTVKVKLYFS